MRDADDRFFRVMSYALAFVAGAFLALWLRDSLVRSGFIHWLHS